TQPNLWGSVRTGDFDGDIFHRLLFANEDCFFATICIAWTGKPAYKQPANCLPISALFQMFTF
ncbi:MAG: hypothetical protein D6796_14745, partial [Caldilineae bacterium]